MEWQISTYQSVGPLDFGKKRQVLRACFKQEAEVRAMSDAKLPLDVYPCKGLYIVYDKFDVCGTVEIKPPGKAIFQGKDLLKLTYQEALQWFQNIDDNIQESEESFVSWKHGILFSAPEKLDEAKQESEIFASTIIAFRKDFFYIKNGIPDPETVNSFHLHAAFVETIKLQPNEYEDVTTTFRAAFAGNKEHGFLIWNGVPVSFSYKNDLPILLEKWLEMVGRINEREKGNYTEDFQCPAFTANWKIQWDQKFIKINSRWKNVRGAYTKALNQPEISELLILKKDFLAEWKMLFKQCKQAFYDAKISIGSNDEQFFIKALKQVEKDLPHFGKFYTENEKVITTKADGRKQVDFTKLSLIGQVILVGLISTFIVIPVWLLSKDKSAIFWFWENMPRVLFFISPFLLIILYFFIKIYKTWQTMKA